MNLFPSSLIYVYFNSTTRVFNIHTSCLPVLFHPSNEQQIPEAVELTEESILPDQLHPLPYVSQEIKKEDYEDLYASITKEGLQQPFVVAQQPDSEDYVLIAGGNTRLEIVQRIHGKSRGARFSEVRCVVIPWPGISTAKLSHLITNDVVHNASFIKRAKAILNFIDNNTDLPIDRTTSDRGVSKFFSDHGFPLYRTTYAAMKYAVDYLDEYLPLSLAASLCTLDVKHIQKLESKLKHSWIMAGKSESEFNQLFTELARSCDHEELDYETFHNVLTEQVWEELQDVEENSSEAFSREVPKVSNQYTEQAPRDRAAARKSSNTSTSLVTKRETSTANDLLGFSSDQEPSEQIRYLALELAQKFGFQDCISMDDRGEFGFLVVDLPSKEASHTTRLVWEYLANFSGACEMSKAELIPCISPDSKLYDEFQEHENSPSLETAKEIDLAVNVDS